MSGITKLFISLAEPFLPSEFKNTLSAKYSGSIAIVVISFLTMLMALSYSIMFLYLDAKVSFISSLAIIVNSTIVVLMLKQRVPKNIIIHLSSIISFSAINGIVLETGGIDSPMIVFHAITPIFCFILGGRISSFFWFMVIATWVFTLGYYNFVNFPFPEITLHKDAHTFAFLINLAGIILWFLIVLFIYEEGKKMSFILVDKQRKKLSSQFKDLTLSNEQTKKTNDKLELYNKEHQQSITYAKSIQDLILPSTKKIQVYFPNSFIYYKPKQTVSGDLYWFQHINRHSIIIAADFMGHGISGAFLSLIGYQIFQEVVNNNDIFSPDYIINAINQKFRKVLKKDTIDSSASLDLGVCIINHSKHRLSYAGAGMPFIYFEGETAKTIQGNEFVIGDANRSKEDWDVHELELDQITSFYICSDGFQKQLNENEVVLGEKRFLRFLASIQTTPFYQQEDAFNNAFETWATNEEQTNDIMILGFSTENIVRFKISTEVETADRPENMMTIL